jgi:DNA (cytosine-5)-methyltransferase 1
MIKPRLLDLFSGAGGAGTGYARAGFDVTGVDIAPQPNYPFFFVQMDAIEFVKQFGHRFDVIHASPPCQAHSALGKGTNDNSEDYPDFLADTRAALDLLGKPYVIENVAGAPLNNPITLCGEMFGLRVIRHRLFESNLTVEQPTHIKHRGRVAGWRHGEKFDGPYFAVYGNGGGKGSLDEWRTAMDMPWAQTKLEIAEAIPPAYTEYIGGQLLERLLRRVPHQITLW